MLAGTFVPQNQRQMLLDVFLRHELAPSLDDTQVLFLQDSADCVLAYAFRVLACLESPLRGGGMGQADCSASAPFSRTFWSDASRSTAFPEVMLSTARRRLRRLITSL